MARCIYRTNKTASGQHQHMCFMPSQKHKQIIRYELSVAAAVNYSLLACVCQRLHSGHFSLCWTAAVRDDLTIIHQQVVGL